jgi:farnesyl-diphosphate farnesyltransferase
MSANELLKSVSRSFYLSIRVLPAQMRPQVAVAYLLARATDTIADTRLVEVEGRRAALARLRSAIRAASELGEAPEPELGELAAAQEGPVGRGTGAERRLLSRVAELLEALRGFEPEDRVCIRTVLDTITAGQDRDLERFGDASPGQIAALETDQELEEYTYQVAGCVGEFWTRMCISRLFSGASLDEQELFRDAIDYGKGLQLVNILRDIAGDLRQGRCYLPRQELSRLGVFPSDLLHPPAIREIRNLVDSYLSRAEERLASGWRYVGSLPRGQVRVRLASAWPALIGARTLSLLRSGNVLDPSRGFKIPRSELQGMIGRSLLLYPCEGAWRRLFDRARKTPG